MHTWSMQIKLHGRSSNFRKSGGAIGDADSHQPAALGSCPPSRASYGLRWTRAVSWRSLLAKPPTRFKQNTRSDLALLQIRDVSWLYRCTFIGETHSLELFVRAVSTQYSVISAPRGPVFPITQDSLCYAKLFALHPQHYRWKQLLNVVWTPSS